MPRYNSIRRKQICGEVQVIKLLLVLLLNFNSNISITSKYITPQFQNNTSHYSFRYPLLLSSFFFLLSSFVFLLPSLFFLLSSDNRFTRLAGFINRILPNSDLLIELYRSKLVLVAYFILNSYSSPCSIIVLHRFFL